MFSFFCRVLFARRQFLDLRGFPIDFVFDFSAFVIMNDHVVPFVRAYVTAVAICLVFLAG